MLRDGDLTFGELGVEVLERASQQLHLVAQLKAPLVAHELALLRDSATKVKVAAARTTSAIGATQSQSVKP